MNTFGKGSSANIENLDNDLTTKRDHSPDKLKNAKEQSINSLVEKVSRMLEKLQQSVDKNISLNSEEQKIFVDWFDRMDVLSREGVDDVHKQQLLTLKNEFDKGQEKVVFDKEYLHVFTLAIKSLTEAAEKKLDNEKNKELSEGLTSFDKGLESLQSSIQEKKETYENTKDKLMKEYADKRQEATKKAATQFIDESVNKSWWGRTLNKIFKIEKYVNEKYVEKKDIGRFRDLVASTVLGLLGAKAFKEQLKDIKNMRPSLEGMITNNLSGLQVPQINGADKINQLSKQVASNLPQTEEELNELVDDKLEEAKAEEQQKVQEAKEKAETEKERFANQIIKPKYREAMEVRGPIDEKVWDKIWDKWYKNNKGVVHQHVDKLQSDFDLAKQDKQRFYSLEYIAQTAVLPVKSVIDLMSLCIDEGVIKSTDVAANGVMKGGKQVIQLGVKSTTFLGGTFLTLTGSVPLDELANSISEVDVDAESRMVLWGMLYRHGGVFHALLSRMADVSGALLSNVLGSGLELEKFKAYSKAGVLGNAKAQIEEFKKFEQALRKSGIFKESLTKSGGADVLTKMLNSMTVSADAVAITRQIKDSSAESFQKFKKQMLAKGPKHKKFIDGIEKEFKGINMMSSGFDYKKYVQNHIKHMSETVIDGLGKSTFGQLIDDAMRHVSPNFSASFRQQAQDIMRNSTNALTETMKMKEIDTRFPPKHMWDRSKLGRELAKTAEFRHKLSFYAESVEDLKDIRKKMEYMAQKAPHMLGSFVRHAPVILVGKEVTEKIKAGGNAGWEITKGFASLAPIIGPVVLINDATSWQASKPVDLEKMTLGAMILAQDAWVMYNTKGNQTGLQRLRNSLLKPVYSTAGMTSQLTGYAHQSAKMAARLPGIYKATVVKEIAKYQGASKAKAIAAGTLKFGLDAGKQGTKFVVRGGLKMAGLAALAYGGYYYSNKFIDDWTGESAERKQLAAIKELYDKHTPQYAHEKLQEMYEKKAKGGEQQEFLRQWIQVGLAQRLGLQDITGVEVGNVTSNPISIVLKEFYHKQERDTIGDELSEVLTPLLKKEEVEIEFSYDTKLLLDSYKLIRKKYEEKGKDTEEAGKLAKETFKEELSKYGENEKTIGRIIDVLG